jgi:hypothetical protein
MAPEVSEQDELGCAMLIASHMARRKRTRQAGLCGVACVHGSLWQLLSRLPTRRVDKSTR